MGRISVALLCLVALLPAATGTAGAAFGGSNGKIVFESTRDGNYELYLMNADGSSQRRLTVNPESDLQPAFSPDGKRIAWVRADDIYTMRVDGSEVRQLTSGTARDWFPAWSPDGSQIVFESNRAGPQSNTEIYKLNADGSGLTRLTNDPAVDAQPAWSARGRIVFTSTRGDGTRRLWLMSPDGSGLTNLFYTGGAEAPNWSWDGEGILYHQSAVIMLTSLFNEFAVVTADGSNMFPAWAPQGTGLVFQRALPGEAPDIWSAANWDGSGQVRLTTNSAADEDPDWQPIGPAPPLPPPRPPPPPPGTLPPPPPPNLPPPPPPPARARGCIVPRVIGLRLPAARTRLTRGHCRVGRVRRARSRRIGRVIGQSPRAGSRRPRGTRVNLRVGRR
ncbi:MAG TPA: PASTA domain-containing protein [Gaiellaceae bacterium]|nr:PASTA domain-containing protein [Gaiellaceae bacterium]